MKEIELSGQKFGRLTVLRQDGVIPNGRDNKLKAWLCLCECGTFKTVCGRDLRTGNTQSCGCYKREETIKRNTTHGMCGTHLYKVWGDMKKRCHGVGSINSKRFYSGVTLCAEWNEFEAFYQWAKDKWSGKLVIDRKDTLKGYSPENCRFITSKENNQNTKRSKWWFIDGIVYGSAYDAALALKCCQSHIDIMCHGRNLNGKYYPPKPNCYSVKKYKETTDATNIR